MTCRQAIATGSSWNDTWICRCTYSLGMSGYGQRSFRRNSCAMPGWSSSGRSSSHVPAHQSRNCPTPSVHALSIAAIVATSQWALNSTSTKWRSGNRSRTPLPTSDTTIRCGTTGAITAADINRSTISSSFSSSWFCVRAVAIMPWSVGAACWLTFTPPVATWKATSMPFACAAAHTRSSARDVYGTGETAGRMIARAPSAATRSISATASSRSLNGIGDVVKTRSRYGAKASAT